MVVHPFGMVFLSYEPNYKITFSDGSTSILSISEIISEIFNYSLTQ